MKNLDRDLLYSGNDYALVNAVVHDAIDAEDIQLPKVDSMTYDEANNRITAAESASSANVSKSQQAINQYQSDTNAKIDTFIAKVATATPAKASTANVDYSVSVDTEGVRKYSVVNGVEGKTYIFSATPVNGGKQLITVTNSDGSVEEYGQCVTTLVSTSYDSDLKLTKFTDSGNLPVISYILDDSEPYAAIFGTFSKTAFSFVGFNDSDGSTIVMSPINWGSFNKANNNYVSSDSTSSLLKFRTHTDGEFVGRVYKLADGSTVDLTSYDKNKSLVIYLRDGRTVLVVGSKGA